MAGAEGKSNHARTVAGMTGIPAAPSYACLGTVCHVVWLKAAMACGVTVQGASGATLGKAKPSQLRRILRELAKYLVGMVSWVHTTK